MYLVNVTDSEKSVDAMEDARDVIGRSTLDPEPFSSAALFIYAEQVRMHKKYCS